MTQEILIKKLSTVLEISKAMMSVHDLDTLLNLISDSQANRLPEPNWEFIRQFDYKNLTKQLAQILNELTPQLEGS